MKKIILLICSFCLLLCPVQSWAKNGKTSFKPNKYTLKRVKQLEKEGWKIFPGDPSMAEQLELNFLLQCNYDEDLYHKYISGECACLGNTLKEAELKAEKGARLVLCEKVMTEISALEEDYIAKSASKTDDIVANQTYIIYKTYGIIQHEDSSLLSCKTDVYCMDQKVCELVQEKNTLEAYKLYMDVADKTYMQLPHIKHAKTVLRLYRQVHDSYEVLVCVYTQGKKSFTKIGNLYYYLEDYFSFLELEDSDTSYNKKNTAEVTYHFNYAKLEDVTIPPKVVYNERSYDVIGVCDNAFWDGRNIKQIKYPVWMNMSKVSLPNSADLIAYNPQPPLLAIEEGSLVFSDATNNNRIDAEEECIIQFNVENKGKGAAENCEARIKMSGSNNGIVTKNISLPSIAVGQKCEVKIPITSNLNTQDGKVTFSIEVAEPGGWGVSPFDLTIATKAYEPPLVQVVDYNVASNSGKISKMEPFTLTFNLQNTQYGDAENVKVKIDLPKNIYLMDGETEFSYPLIKSGEAKAIKITLAANNNYMQEQIPINVDIKERHGKYAENKKISLSMNKPTLRSITIAEKKEAQKEIQLAMMSSDVDRDIPIASAQNNNTLVLIVANEHYQSMPTVPYAVNDGNVFKEYCVKTLGIPTENIMYQADVTLNGFRQKVALLQKKVQARAQAGRDTHIIFYYTGHGMPDVNTQSAYLMPVDGFDENVSTGYKLDNLYQLLGQMPAKTVTVFLDACFSGVNRNDKALAVHKGARLTAKGGAPTGNMVIFAASQGNQTASVNDKEKHGLFTYCLLKKLKATEGDVSLSDLATYLMGEVNMKSLDLFEKEQIPSVVASPEVENQWQNWKLK